MNVTDPTVIPTVPTILVVLINFLAPYLISFVTASFWPKNAKKAVAVGVSALLTAAVILLAHFGFGFAIPAWPQLIILGILASQASYTALVKDSADALTALSGVGSKKNVVTTTAVTKSLTVTPAVPGTTVNNIFPPA